ncbi:MAG: pyridoxamine 5-phosphate oxidase [Ilumatobacteraceae bacterium]|nr:pyridoxamine 5-phosphate oxidase [Ilumatobacteraceae bacterium]
MTEIHATAMPFAHTIASVAELRELYRPPSKLVVDKERSEIDEASARFIARSRFLVVGTHDAAGRADVSPRGGPGGFVRVLDPRRLVIADLGGNNRIDTLQNIVDTGRIALLFVVPGRSETVRVNGAGWVTTDPEILASFAMPRLPTAAIGVQVEATFIHCAKAFRRGVMWEPEAWAELADAPDAADIIACQGLVEAPADVVRGHLAADYDAALAWEAGGD